MVLSTLSRSGFCGLGEKAIGQGIIFFFFLRSCDIVSILFDRFDLQKFFYFIVFVSMWHVRTCHGTLVGVRGWLQGLSACLVSTLSTEPSTQPSRHSLILWGLLWIKIIIHLPLQRGTGS